MTDNDARIRQAETEQARILAALPAYPQYGYYVKTGLAGYGPDLESEDYPVTDGWEALADVIAEELRNAADYAYDGASIAGDQADEQYSRVDSDGSTVAALDLYRDAWHAFKQSGELRTLAATFDNSRKDAPLYAGRPDLWHATIYDLIGRHFPVDVYDHSRLYVWECEEAPECPRHGGPWGDDETCEHCTYDDGSPRPVSDPGPLLPED